MTAKEISQLLKQFTFSASDEDELQRGIELCLTRNWVSYQREFRLSERDRVDFTSGDHIKRLAEQYLKKRRAA